MRLREIGEARKVGPAGEGMVLVQTTLSVVFEIEPQTAPLARSVLAAMNAREAAGANPDATLRRQIPSLHFMSMTVFDDDQYDPVVVLEANFDGAPSGFWPNLEAAIGPDLRTLLRCAKIIDGPAGPLLTALAAPGSAAPLAPILDALSVKPAVFHHGNRGLDRGRIEREAALFDAVARLADDPALRKDTAQMAHAKLRAAVLPAFPWLTQAPPPRIPWTENLADWARLAAFIAVVVGALAAPALVMAAVFQTGLWPLFLGVLCIALRLRVGDMNGATGRPRLATRIAKLAVLIAGLANIAAWHADAPCPTWLQWPAWATLLASAILGVGASLLAVFAWLRTRERADPETNAPQTDEAELRRMAAREDFFPTNHMLSIVHIKPGVLRTVLALVGLTGLGLILRVWSRSRAGYLASMRTIHFAHWAVISNGGRLMFHSNFDGSWESYLDDFIEKANVGLTLAWTNGVGFPKTRFLIFGGATQGRKFKAFARASMRETLFWFAAYPHLSVNQIERQARLAAGLRQASLSPQAAQAWALDL